MPASLADAQAQLARFGLRAFRRGQGEVIEAVLGGRDCLCIMPTGGGKSLCYQLPALMLPGVTLVVSPLIALMKDQVDALALRGIPATFINSSLSSAQQRDRLGEIAAGQVRLVYVAPERFKSRDFLDAVRTTRVGLLAIDEAHCVSEWGHDFRPDYARLGRFRRRMGFPQTIALTATATPTVRDDIAAMLELRRPAVFVTGFARENLSLEVKRFRGGSGSAQAKKEQLVEFLRENDGAGIIYAATRKKCAEVVESVQGRIRRNIGLYHAGMERDDRRRVQEEFMSGRLPIIVATNAFGMGIDKADLRFVVHYNMPGSLEAYYQEAGRAGRDGRPARCRLLFSPSDRYVQEFFIDNAYPTREVVEKVYEYLRRLEADPIEITLEEIKQRLGLPVGPEGVRACELLLEKCGAIERLDAQQNQAAVRIDSELPTLVDLLPAEAKVRRRVLRAVERIVGDLRGERVYFHPREIAAETELKIDSVVRALKALGELTHFDYVSPFRGRAVQVRTKSVPFEKLEIDFAELERRRQAEIDKLNRVVGYAMSRRCRQLEILDYFGDQSRARCGVCDNCPPAVAGAGSVGNDSDADDDCIGQGDEESQPLTTAVRMALSGVARACQKGRFGLNLVAKMLFGSRSKQIEKLGLDGLSTYGLLSHLKQSEIVELLEALLQQGLIHQRDIDRFRPVVELTPLGGEIMRGEKELPEPPPVSPRLLRRLGNAPQQSDAAPRSGAPQANQPGTAPHGNDPAESDRGMSRPRLASRHDSSPPESRPGFYWTWRLLADGYPPSECAACRGISLDTVLDDAERALDEGHVVEVGWLLTRQEIETLRHIVGARPSRDHRHYADELPPELTRRHLTLFLKTLRSQA